MVGKASPLLFGMSKPYVAFKNTVSNIGGLSERQMETFHEYCKYLLASQRHKINIADLEDSYFKPSKLSAVPENFPYLNILPHRHPELIFDRHFADSLSIIPTLAKLTPASAPVAANGKKVLDIVDIGSGGGLPGIAIAIARPEWRVTVVDTVDKKCNFLRRVVSELGLNNVTVVTARAESLAYYRDDVAVGSAVNADGSAATSDVTVAQAKAEAKAEAKASAAAQAEADAEAEKANGADKKTDSAADKDGDDDDDKSEGKSKKCEDKLDSSGRKPRRLMNESELVQDRRRRIVQGLTSGQVPYMREAFDIALTRGVATWEVVAEFSLPLVRVGGHCVGMKTRSLFHSHIALPGMPDDEFEVFAAPLRANNRSNARQVRARTAMKCP